VIFGTDRLQRLWRLPRQRKRLLIESGWALACMAWRVRRWNFSSLAATLGTLMPPPAPADIPTTGGAAPPDSSDLALATDVRWAIAAWVRRLRPAPTCLMQATAAQCLLALRGLPSTLYFGVQSLGATAASPEAKHALGAHAWLQCAGLVVTGEREAAGFRPIAAYRLVPTAKHP